MIFKLLFVYMGYVVEMYEENFNMMCKNKEKALENIIDFMNDNNHSPDDKSFKWLNGVDHNNWHCLEHAMSEWRLPVSVDINGNICGISFCGDKKGDELKLFDEIAEYVSNDSYIIMGGSYDQVRWCYLFKDSTVERIMLDSDDSKKRVFKEVILTKHI